MRTNIEKFFNKKDENGLILNKLPKKNWWDSNTLFTNNEIDQIKKNSLNEKIEKCEKKYNHYIETADDDFSNVDSIEINYGTAEKANIAKNMGTWEEKNMESNDGENVTKTLIGETSIPYLLKNEINGGSKNEPIRQGESIISNNKIGLTKGNPDSKNFLKDIKTLDDFYKYQFMKKKNYTKNTDAEGVFIDYKPYDTRFVDTSTGLDTYNNPLPGREKGNYDKPDYVINQIGYNDLFSKPHKNQGKTDNIVSRSFFSDDGNIQNVIKNGKCIPGKSCCNGDKECYPNKVLNIDSETETETFPKMVFSTCKPCPIGLLNTYEFKKNDKITKYFSNIGGFYSSESGKPNNNEKKTLLNGILNSPVDLNDELVYKNGYKVCKACDFHAGCKYDEFGNYRDTHFEAQSCINGNNRVCKPCKICKMGTEFTEVGCGEGGITQDAVCSTCTPCKEGTFKVSGCANYNSLFDNNCIPYSDCVGKPESNDQLSEEYYEDPGEGNRFYEVEKGYQGGFEGGGPEGKPLKNPYFGQDRKCRKCDVCPEGTKMIGDGCMGINSTKNTMCQRLINIDRYVDKLQVCAPGKFFNRDILRKKLTYNFDKNPEENLADGVDERVVNFYKVDMEKRESLPEDQKNNIELYQDNILPEFSDEDLKILACVDCKKCETGKFQNPKNPGCEGDTDTICIPKTECKSYEIIESEGDDKTDRKCGPCKCPPNQYGLAKCEGNKIVSGCKDRIICKKGEYKYDDPIQYGDVTRDTICKPCRKCPPNSYQLADCSGSTDTVCKIHKECGENQYILKKGTDISDTICKCIDGFELPTVTDENDINYGQTNLEATNCVPSEGKCWTNPCHPNAKCYDRYDDKGNFLEYVCRCNLEKGYGETEFMGKGLKGCRKILTEHSHKLEDIEKPTNYGFTESTNKIMTHTDKDYHLDLSTRHIHKN